MRRICSVLVAFVLTLSLALPTRANQCADIEVYRQTIYMSNAVNCAHQFAAVIDEDNVLWMWGNNYAGQLGIGTRQHTVSTPVKVMEDVASVALGNLSTAILKIDGSLWTCGWCHLGMLGDGGNGNADYDSNWNENYPITSFRCQTVPQKIMDDVISVSCGTNYMAAVKSDGSLWTWGGWSSYLGNGHKGNAVIKLSEDAYFQTIPTKIMDDVADVSCSSGASASTTAVIKKDGSLWMFGSCGEFINGKVHWVDGVYYDPVIYTPTKVMDGVKAVSGGGKAIIKTDGSLWIRGSNSYGELGIGVKGKSENNFVKTMDSVKSVFYGNGRVMAIKNDDSLWAWGENRRGELGNNGNGNDIYTDSMDGTSFAIQTIPLKIMDGVASASCGMTSSMVLKKDGSIWTMGLSGWSNGVGFQLGYTGGNITKPAARDKETGEAVYTYYQMTPKQVPGIIGRQPTAASKPSYNETSVGGFQDVHTSDYFAPAVTWAVENAITKGTSSTTFSPSTTCTVEQILTFIWRSKGSPTSKTPCPFSGVRADSPYYGALCWANENGIIAEETKSPTAECTRAMAMSYLWRAAGSPVTQGARRFSDVETTAYYSDAVSWAVKIGVTNGTSGDTFSPDTLCSRGQIVTFLYRSMGAH